MQRSFEISFYTNTARENEEVKRSGVCSSSEKEEYTFFFSSETAAIIFYLFIYLRCRCKYKLSSHEQQGESFSLSYLTL